MVVTRRKPRRVSVDAPGDDDEPYSETSSAAHAAATDAAKGSRAKGGSGSSSGGSTGGPLLADADDRWRKAAVRTVSTVVMLGGFVLIFSLGHVAVGCLVLLLQGIIFNEIVGLRYARMQEIGIPHFRFMTWYFYLATVFYAYGRVLHNLILETFGEDAVFLQYHDFASFVIYVAGILAFILNLRKGLYRQQFGQFAWTHMTLLLVVVQSTLMLHNIFAGLIWFLLPCLLVITNDIFGFISGFFFGRTPLIKLSPKKTWEGFIGALIATVAVSFLLARVMSQQEWLACPKPTLHLGHADCGGLGLPALFEPQEWRVPGPVRLAVRAASGVEWESARMRPMQVHALAIGLFASLIAPFGGFFASGFKRAFRIKDFSSTIPGHGGLTDRMDCQILMAVFVYVYYSTFVAAPRLTAAGVLAAVARLPVAEQVAVARQILAAAGVGA